MCIKNNTFDKTNSRPFIFLHSKMNKLKREGVWWKGKSKEEGTDGNCVQLGRKNFATVINRELIFAHSEESVTYVKVIPTQKIFSKLNP